MIRLLLLVLVLSCTTIYSQEKLENTIDFKTFLTVISKKEAPSSAQLSLFNKTSWRYWKTNKLDYNLHPEKYRKTIALYHEIQEKHKKNHSPKLDRFENKINEFKRFDNRNTLAKNAVLFIGSSSIVYWETSKSFPDFPVINRGFGGASIPEILYYYNDIIKKHTPALVVLYCDIDVENGKSPQFAVQAFQKLISKIQNDFPTAEVLLLAMKPTLIDDFLGKAVRKNKITSNKMLNNYCKQHKNLHFIDITKPMLQPNGSIRSDIFLSDGMHLNSLGYTLWTPILRKKILALKNN